MIGMMRRLTQNKFFGSIFFGLVIISMAVWGPGLSDIFSGGFGTNLIKAGDRSITEQQFNRKFDYQMSEFRRENPGSPLTRQQAVEQGMLDQVYNIEKSRLVNLGYARTLGTDASGKALLNEVQSIEAFKNPLTNEFDTQYFRNALANSNINQSDFESDWQDRLTINYIYDGLNAALIAPTDLARVQAVFDGEIRHIKWMPIEQTALPERPEPTEDELQAFYNTRLTAFESPERRRLTLLSLSPEDFIHQSEVTEDKILETYEATKFQRLVSPELRTFDEYIFPDEDSAKAAFGVLVVGGELPDPEGVSRTARTLSTDQVAIEEFRVQLYTPGVEVGAVVGPLLANGNWMLGVLTEIEQGTPKTLEETREDIRNELAAENAEIAYYTALNEFDDLIGQGLSVAEIGAHYGAPVTSFAAVDQRGLTEQGEFLQVFAASGEAFQQAFQRPQGQKTDRFDLDLSTIMISVDEIVPKSTPPLEDIRERVLTAYKITKDGEALKAAADAVKLSVDNGVATLEEQAELYNTTVEIPERGLRRTALDRTLPQSILQSAYGLDEGQLAVVQGRAPAELIVVMVERVDRPQADELDILAPISAPKIVEQLQQDILQAFEQDVQNTIELNANDAAFAAYKRRLLEDQ